MSNSPLVVYTQISPNKSSPRKNKIDTVSIHCTVAQCTAEALGQLFSKSSTKASSNYGVDKDGRIGMYVEEKDRSWCTSSSANDNRAITIEVASDNKHPYAVNEKAFNALIDLLVDICQRNGIKQLLWKADKSLIGQVDKQNMTVHRWFANKACPGKYLYDKHGEIAELVNKRLGVVEESTTNTTTEDKKEETTTNNTSTASEKKSENNTTTEEFKKYVVKTRADVNLNIRKGPGTNYSSIGYIKPGYYTIVKESTGNGATKWGKLKSGIGWISLDFCTRI